MRITNIYIKNFRNLKELKLQIPTHGLLIYGKNGCGKTNFLEAISYFSFGKSFRLLSDREIIEFGKKEFFLEGDFEVSNNLKNIKIKVSGTKKIIKIDNKLIKKVTELYRFIKVVYFSPNDIEIASGYPTPRRRFFDIAISQYSYKYLELLRLYNRILKQRNALLKKDFTNAEKQIWDKQFLSVAKDIILQRLAYLKDFNKQLDMIYGKIANNYEKAVIKYLPKYAENTTNIDEILKEELKRKTKDEIALQRTMFGPHLHDYGFVIGDKIAKKFASQGQKRSLVIAIRLAQAKMIDISQKETPILIFDDVLSELDKNRAENIFKLLGDAHQIFVATPHAENYSQLNIKSLNLENLLGNEDK